MNVNIELQIKIGNEKVFDKKKRK